MGRFLVILIVFMSFAVQFKDTGSSDEDQNWENIVNRILEIPDEDLSWAKPILHVDMERMLELKEAGVLTFHEASWYVEVEEDER